MEKVVRRILILSAALLGICRSGWSQGWVVSGTVSDAGFGEPLIGVTVVSGETYTSTNNYGFYSLSPLCQDETCRLLFSYVGYHPETVFIPAGRDTVLNVRLLPEASIREAMVSARAETGIHSVYAGSEMLSGDILSKAPALLGEGDVLKSFQMLPGVQEGTGGFAGLYVRGGGSEENLLLLDGVDIYNATHFSGVFSAFMPEAVKTSTMYKGAFPAKYGGRVSSVLDIRTKDGDPEHYHGSVGLGLLSTKVHLDGPIWKGHTSFQVSGRVTNTLFAAPLILSLQEPSERVNYYFYDLNAKVTHRIGDRDKIYLSSYNGRDAITSNSTTTFDGSPMQSAFEQYDRAKFHWGNNVLSAGWTHIYSGRLFSTTVLYSNRYKMLARSHCEYRDLSYKESSTDHMRFESSIKDIGLRSDFEYALSPEHSLSFGAEFIHHNFCPEAFSDHHSEFASVSDATSMVLDTMIVEDSGFCRGYEASVYAEDRIILGDRLTFSPGLRFTVINADRSKTYASLQPRISTRYVLDDGLSVKASYSKMTQYVHLLTSTQVDMIYDLWAPVTGDIPPVISRQASLGLYKETTAGWEYSLEGYFKHSWNVLEFIDGACITLGHHAGWENNVCCGLGRAYGVEMLVRKTEGRTTGWIGYTLSRSEHRDPDGMINRGEWYPVKYDRRHYLDLFVMHNLSRKVDISASWTIHTGGAFSAPEGQTYVIDRRGNLKVVDYVRNRCGYRLPATNRLNLSLNKHVWKSRHENVWNVSLYNAFNSVSPDFMDMERRQDFFREPDYDYTKPWKEHSIVTYKMKVWTILPILPSIGYTCNF